MQLGTIRTTVEALSQEVRTAVLLKQATLVHIDPDVLRHLVICILDAPISGWIAQEVARHPIELQHPIGISLRSLNLTRPDFRHVFVEGDDCLGSISTSRGSHPKNI